MSSNEFGRETHWQLVKSDGRKPWHARLVSNYRVIVYSPQYRHRADAVRAIEIAAPEWIRSKVPLTVDERGQANEHSLPDLDILPE